MNPKEKNVPNETEEMLQHSADACEQVAKAIEGIGAAAKKLLNGPLSVEAACLLIREAMPHGTKSTVTVKQVEAVLRGAAMVGHIHLKAPTGKRP